jgi:signal transduction histidine kinase
MNTKKPSKSETFLHDLVNHTHGLLLFLNQKKRIGKMEVIDIDQLINELKLMQNIIRVESDFNHKNFKEYEVEASIDEIIRISKTLISVYILEDDVQLKTNISELNFNLHNNFKLDSVLFYRVLSNILKNISEASPSIVEVSFSITEESVLLIETKNDINHKVDEGGQVRHPVGLFSVKTLLENVGGTFQTSSTSSSWINKISIPLIVDKSTSKIAA